MWTLMHNIISIRLKVQLNPDNISIGVFFMG